MESSSIIVFLRFPTKGKVKTRLAATIGDSLAAKIYKLLAENIISSVKGVESCDKYIFYSEAGERESIENWLGESFSYVVQRGDDLGERMSNAFETLFSRGSNKVLIIGSDIPGLSASEIQSALSLLDNSQVVIGPSSDGGYYLLGLKEYNYSLFQNIEFSTKTVFDKTLEIIHSLGLTVKLLPVLRDIDTAEDLNLWLKNNSKPMANEMQKLIANE